MTESPKSVNDSPSRQSTKENDSWRGPIRTGVIGLLGLAVAAVARSLEIGFVLIVVAIAFGVVGGLVAFFLRSGRKWPPGWWTYGLAAWLGISLVAGVLLTQANAEELPIKEVKEVVTEQVTERVTEVITETRTEVVVVTEAPSPGPIPQPAAAIVVPRDGQEDVPGELDVEGTSENLGPDDELWVVVRPKWHNNRFFPENPVPVETDGDWVLPVVLGGDDQSGRKFDLLAVVAVTEAARQELAEYNECRQRSDCEGLETLPDGVDVAHRITVTRE